MNLRDTIARYAPDHKHLVGIVPDEELAVRVITELTEDAIDPNEVWSQSQHETELEDAVEAATEKLKDEIQHILNDVEWDSGEQLSKLIREVIE